MPRPAVLCTLVKITGSAPADVGTRMWVSAERFSGTLGGGEFEWRVLSYAREILAAPKAAPHLKEYVLCKEMGQCCGGRVEVFFEPVPRRKAAHFFGGGHVGRAAVQVLSGMPFDIHLIDPRPQWGAGEGLPADVQAQTADPLDYARSRAWAKEDAVCVMTHSHDLDFLLVKHFLRQPIGYLGLIGSEHKAQVFLARLLSGTSPKIPEGAAPSNSLERCGADKADWERLWEEKMHCPIGAPLPGKNPKIVAVSIAAELLKEWA